MAKTLIVLGNGFSIDFIKKFNEYCISQKKAEKNIDLTNLFSLGDKVINPWNHKQGFLSFADCQSLWTLGAHPYISSQETSKLLSDIVTCVNMYKNQESDDGFYKVEKIHLKAYCELIAYLKSLFVYYNSQITDDELKDFLEKTDWGWQKFFLRLQKTATSNELIFVTYNYDIWLERILKTLQIKFSCLNIKDSDSIKILKPHGSINFCCKKDLTINSYKAHTYSLLDNYEDLIIHEENMLDYKPILIPPAGESKNSGFWAKNIREEVLQKAKTLTENDKIIICGLSYWYVDRYEIDKLLLAVNPKSELCFINPNPPSELNSVLMTIFDKFRLYKTSETLGELK